MNTLAIVGLQWGDEGKGKIIDLLSKDCVGVVRAQGGHNAGHTVIADEEEFHLHLIPSGIIYPQTQCFIGGGTVIDPRSLIEEIQGLEKRGIQLKNRLLISPYAHVIFPYHYRLDQMREKSQKPIGTTGRGIGPCYEDRVGRRGICVGEWMDANRFRKRLQEEIKEKNAFFSLENEEKFAFEVLLTEYEEYAKKLSPFVHPFEESLDQMIRKGAKVLFEGAQGALLDVYYGTYPYVTSSSTTSGSLSYGAGLGPQVIQEVIGVMKAYTTRVGNGPFPTELTSKERKLFGSKSAVRELGTTTGRERRLGWLDIPLLKEAIRLNGVTSLALTKLDILDSFESIKICVEYENQQSPPLFTGDWEGVSPKYETLPGWKESTKKIKNVKEFPKNVRLFLNRIETLLSCPVHILSIGPEREKTVFLNE